ncbi:copper resistance CopC family protein [Oceanobacillus neutriphilus]|uniref:CopC domain-containing protein n=1 Tax=Oceanobacillus neutriphilus TaxID=531815 RepID=A0ABQ2NZH7_9BACI|nr:copper resistance protein CopC [Oceanobacillus neutriphilus]GGP14171.1 hypothetical protein GCM10011346_37070 [Oceanobacillus neutriphilus]
MKKLTGALALVTLLFIFSASPAFAHTHLDTSDPEDGSTVTEALDSITLNFETVIEESAVLELQKEDGTEITLDNITVNDDELSADVTEPLENGAYTLSWDIIGVDGHPMEDSLSFDVDIEETVSEETTEGQKDEDAAEDQADENEAASESDVQDTSEDSNSNTLLITILLVAIIAVVAIVLLKRKK